MAGSYTKSPPPAPADSEVLRNIEVLAAFVARNGAQFEQLARTKKAEDPKFGFLFGGSPGTEVAQAHAFYEWKKKRLEQAMFASDGSDDVQLKICLMVQDGPPSSKLPCFPPLSSDAHAMDDAKLLPSAAAEKKKSDLSAVDKIGTPQDDSIRRAGRPPHHRARDDVKSPASIGTQKKLPESTITDRVGKSGVLLEDSSRKPHHPLHGARDDAKPPLSAGAEVKKSALPVVGAPQDDSTRRSSQPLHGAKGDVQKEKSDLAVVDSISRSGIPKDDLKSSSGRPPDGARGTEEVEMDHQVAEATEKQAKEAYGLRLLKSALADYVKEVLKPAWKEGNMSKESYKAIVKKVVDKVSGSVQGHQVPKSQENVDQYMAQSQAKIAKLVQGYVEKFKKN